MEFETRARVYHALHWISKHVGVLLDHKMCNDIMFSWFVRVLTHRRVIGDASCTVLLDTSTTALSVVPRDVMQAYHI